MPHLSYDIIIQILHTSCFYILEWESHCLINRFIYYKLNNLINKEGPRWLLYFRNQTFFPWKPMTNKSYSNRIQIYRNCISTDCYPLVLQQYKIPSDWIPYLLIKQPNLEFWSRLFVCPNTKLELKYRFLSIFFVLYLNL